MEDFEYVVKNSDHVKINTNIIDSFIKSIEKKQYSHWSEQDDYFGKLNEKEIIIFSFMLQSMNFCFWPNYNWKVEHNGKEYCGSDTLLFVLLKAINNNIIKLDINSLIHLSKDDFYSFMKENNTYPLLMEERYYSLMETIKTIHSNNNFWDELFSIKSDLELENYITNNFNNFRDVSTYKGRVIKFNKRCRLVIADLFYISSTIRNNIKTINNIKGCADYSLPRFFREIKIFDYSDELSQLIDNGIEIKHNSNYEIEIRSSTLFVLEYIKKRLKENNIIISSIELDNIIWNISRIKKTTLPHHTISIYY